jgi:hypothetical protein
MTVALVDVGRLRCHRTPARLRPGVLLHFPCTTKLVRARTRNPSPWLGVAGVASQLFRLRLSLLGDLVLLLELVVLLLYHPDAPVFNIEPQLDSAVLCLPWKCGPPRLSGPACTLPDLLRRRRCAAAWEVEVPAVVRRPSRLRSPHAP